VASILIKTSGPDYGFNREQYDALVADLESQGASVDIETAPEERGALQAVREVAVYVKDFGGAALTLGALAAIIKKHLRRRRVGPQTVTIYGPDGREVLSTVDLEDEV
jgi:hypothetical protein